MKKLTAVAIIILFCAVFVRGTAAAEWEKVSKTHTLGYMDDTYSITNSDGTYCRVLILKNSNRMAIYAIDPNWNGKTATQTAEINSKGTIIFNETKILQSHTNVLGFPYDTQEKGGYWVFSEKCLAAAKDLPEEVRKRFNGAFGVR